MTTKTNATMNDQLAAALAQLKEDHARAAVAKAGGNVRLLLPHITARIGLEFIRGRFEVRAVDERGAVRLSGDKPMTLDDMMSEFKRDEDFAGAFRAVPAPAAPAPKLMRRK